MIYALVLTLFLSVDEKPTPLVLSVPFATMKACEIARKEAEFSTSLPVVAGSAKCEQVKKV